MANRILMNASGLKITKAGYNVLTNTDPGRFAFDSDYPGFGVRQSGSVSIPAASGATPGTVSVGFTNLGYIPHGFVCYLASAGVYGLPWSKIINTSGVYTGDGVTYTVSASSLVFSNHRRSGAVTAYYVLFHRPVV